MFEFKNAGKSISEGVYVVQSPKTRGGEGLPKLWTHHEIQTQRQSFLRNVKEAVTGKREIYCEAIVWLTMGASAGFERAASRRAAGKAGAGGKTAGACRSLTRTADLDSWCDNNCRVGFCPLDTCSCATPIPSAHAYSTMKDAKAAKAKAAKAKAAKASKRR